MARKNDGACGKPKLIRTGVELPARTARAAASASCASSSNIVARDSRRMVRKC